jgi:hypothetical protein
MAVTAIPAPRRDRQNCRFDAIVLELPRLTASAADSFRKGSRDQEMMHDSFSHA